MKRFLHGSWILWAAAALLLAACATRPADSGRPASAPAEGLELTILHVNDTHSKLEPVATALKVDGRTVYAELGGFPQLWSALDLRRKADPEALFLHAGDVFQGTLYFTQFLGKADTEFLNTLGVQALALGNHEFDKGPGVLRSGLLDLAAFPVLGANITYADEAELAGTKILPYSIKTVRGQQVGIIGLTLADTPYISSPGPNIVFSDPAAAAALAAGELERRGVNKIIVLSHIGYAGDLEIARKTAGVDVIVGGHTHTLLGELADYGLAAKGPYPTVVRNDAGQTVLVVQGWEWAKVLGELQVGFDAAGQVSSWKASPRLLVGDSWFRIYDLTGAEGKPVRVEFTRTAAGWKALESDGRTYSVEPPAERAAAHQAALEALTARLAADPRVLVVAPKAEGKKKLEPYAAALAALKAKVACEAAEELTRGNNRGPGPVIADGMLWKTAAEVAIMNPGGVRTNLNPGPISVAGIYELQPFGNTLVTLPLSGAELLRVIEDMCDYTITTYADKNPQTALIYVSGLSFRLDVAAKKGFRLNEVQVGQPGAYTALDPIRTYKLVVNSFMAAGGDKNFTLKELAARQYDTGFIDSEVTLEYVLGRTLRNTPEARVSQ